MLDFLPAASTVLPGEVLNDPATMTPQMRAYLNWCTARSAAAIFKQVTGRSPTLGDPLLIDLVCTAAHPVSPRSHQALEDYNKMLRDLTRALVEREGLHPWPT